MKLYWTAPDCTAEEAGAACGHPCLLPAGLWVTAPRAAICTWRHHQGIAKAIRKKDISTMMLEEKTMAQWRDNAFRSGDGARDLADG